MLYHGQKDNDLSELESTVREAAADLQPHTDRFDSIAVTGLSGIVVGLQVSLALKKPLTILRKPNDDSHGRPLVNEKNLGKRVLWVDDFVYHGGTRRRITEAVEGRGAKIVGNYLYGSAWDEERDTYGPELEWKDD